MFSEASSSEFGFEFFVFEVGERYLVLRVVDISEFVESPVDEVFFSFVHYPRRGRGEEMVVPQYIIRVWVSSLLWRVTLP